MRRSVLGCSLCLAAFTYTFNTAWGGEPLQLAPPPHPPTAELIRQLGSEDFRTREIATQKLAALDLPEPPILLVEATRSSDSEIRERAVRAANAIQLRAVDRILGPGRAFAKRGQLDLFVAATARWDRPADDDRLWQPVLDLATTLAGKARYEPWPPLDCRKGFTSMTGFRQSFRPRFIRSDQPYVQEETAPDGTPRIYHPGAIMAPGISSPKAFTYNLVVSRDGVSAKTRIGTSVVCVNGDLAVGGNIGDAIVVCDGDVTVAANVLESLIIARGDIRLGAYATGSKLIAGGAVRFGEPMPPGKALVNVIREGESNPLGFVTFFELSAVGVEAKAADGAVRVAAVADGKPFAKAGVKVGDAISSVGGKKPDSPESLRRLLRDALAVGDAAVTLRRGDATLDIKVSLPE